MYVSLFLTTYTSKQSPTKKSARESRTFSVRTDSFSSIYGREIYRLDNPALQQILHGYFLADPSEHARAYARPFRLS